MAYRYYINNADAGHPEFMELEAAMRASLRLGGDIHIVGGTGGPVENELIRRAMRAIDAWKAMGSPWPEDDDDDGGRFPQ